MVASTASLRDLLRTLDFWQRLIGLMMIAAGVALGLDAYFLGKVTAAHAVGIAVGFAVLAAVPLVCACRVGKKLDERCRSSTSTGRAVRLAAQGGVVVALTYLYLIGLVHFSTTVGVVFTGGLCNAFFGLHGYHLLVAAGMAVGFPAVEGARRALFGGRRHYLTPAPLRQVAEPE